MSGLYIHIPYCRKACHYCNFHFSTTFHSMDKMIGALCDELKQRATETPPPQTIYLGGGTPSVLKPEHFDAIFNTIHQYYDTSDTEEITCEANPEDLTPVFAQYLKNAGVTRLSIGIQSMDDELLRWMNRNHDASQSVNAIENVHNAGFEHLNLDIIYGLPHKSTDAFRRDILNIIAFNPDHISAYGLTIEPQTVFDKLDSTARLSLPDEDTFLQQASVLVDTLNDELYEQYELSNFCKDGKYAVHNTNYWWDKSYTGIGPGAHSYNGITRRSNVTNNTRYINLIHNRERYYEEETLTRNNQMNDRIMISLRTKWGLNVSAFDGLFGADLLKDKKEPIEDMKAAGWISLQGNHLFVAEKGKWVTDEITVRMLY